MKARPCWTILLYKELKILKLPDMVHLQNYLFMSWIEANKKFTETFIYSTEIFW